MNQEAQQAFIRARASLIIEQPFFGALALLLKPVEDGSIKTLATNGKCIKYNPEFLMSMPHELRKSAVAHEVMHCVLDHMARTGGRDKNRANKAADYVTNEILKEAGFRIGDNWLCDSKYAGMSFNEVYNLLPEEPEDDGSGDGNGPPGLGNDLEPSGADASEQEAVAQEWKINTQQAANAAKAQGKLSAGMERFITEMMKPKVDWKAILRRFISQTTNNDFNWMRPNRMFIASGIYVPGLYSESMGDIVIGVDTSGSISNEILNAFKAEVGAIIAEMQPANTHVIYCDSQVNHVDTFARHDVFDMKPHGGGGTEFHPVFDYVREKNLRPACLVYLTDLYGSTNFTSPDYPTLWTCISDQVAPWGETVKLSI